VLPFFLSFLLALVLLPGAAVAETPVGDVCEDVRRFELALAPTTVARGS
jgi:hypothetical protein